MPEQVLGHYGDIEGHGASDYSGKSVSLSADGTRLAIGATHNDGVNGTDSGHVRIFNNTSGSSWVQVGSDIDGNSQDDRVVVSFFIYDG